MQSIIRFSAGAALLILLLTQYCAGQSVSSLEFPVRFQLYARDWSNTATVPVAGSVTSAGYDSAVVKIYRNGALWKQRGQRLNYSGSSAQFDLSTAVDAGMSEYQFRLYLKTGSSSAQVASADSIACGDVYIIAGQSNAHPTELTASYKNEYCRTLGVQTGNQNYNAYNPADTLWGFSTDMQGSGGEFSGPYVVGVWGLRLQRYILETYQMPTAVINGAAGGSPIEDNLRKADPLDLTTIYGRLLYRMRAAHLADKAKAIFWYQGESNSYVYTSPDGSISYYYGDFVSQLVSAWSQDYTGVQKKYFFQIRASGCGPSDIKLRDLQRTFADTYPNSDVVSTCFIPGHNGCHYDANGYMDLAQDVFRLVARDFYYSSDVQNIKPPNISSVFYTNSQRTEIGLLFRERNAGLSWPNDTLIWNTPRSLKDNIFLDDQTGLVQGGRVSGDTVKIQLTRSVNAKTITYLPQQVYPGTQTVYEGPFITNARGIGALTFYHFPIGAGVSAVDNGTSAPEEFSLSQNYPNPFNPTTTIQFSLPSQSAVRIEVLDLLGRTIREVAGGTFAPGPHELRFDATNLASGAYYFRLEAQPEGVGSRKFTQTRSMIISK